MEYFRQHLLTYSTQRQISTLLHIHTEIDKPKLVASFTKTSSYVDNVINEYSVRMYPCPDLGPTDAKLAYNVYSQRSQGGNVYQFEEFKRKPLKKKISKKSVAPSLPNDHYKICPCCETRVVMKHRCQHNLCEKPCMRLKKHRSGQHGGSGYVHYKKNNEQDEQQFTPQRSELDNEQSKSKSSNVGHQSEFQQEIGLLESESFASNMDRNRKSKGKGKKGRDPNRQTRSRNANANSNANSSGNGNNGRRPMTREVSIKQEQNSQKDENKSQHINLFNSVNENVSKDPEPPIRRRKLIKKSSKRVPNNQSSNNQSQIEPQSAQRQLKRNRSEALKRSVQNSSKQNNQNQLSINGFKKRLNLFNFCTVDELKQNQIYNIRINDPADGQDGKKIPKDKQIQRNDSGKSKEKEKIIEQEMPFQPGMYPFEQELEMQRKRLSNMQQPQQQQPVVNAIFDPPSDDGNSDNKQQLFQQKQ